MALSALDSTWRPDVIAVALGVVLVLFIWQPVERSREIEAPLLTDAGNDFHKIMNEGYSRVSLMHNPLSFFALNQRITVVLI